MLDKLQNNQSVTVSSEGSLPAVTSRTYGVAWVMWALAVAFVLFQFFLQLTSGQMISDLMSSFALSAAGGGVLASAYYYVYASLQPVAGALIDRYGTRRLLSIGAVVCGTGCVLFAHAHVLLVAFSGRLLMGMGASFAFVGVLSLVCRWFPANRFALMTGLTETVGMMGALFGSLFLASWVYEVGWRFCMSAASLLACVIGVTIAMVVRDCPKVELEEELSVDSRSFREIGHSILALLKHKMAWINGIYSGLMFAIVTVFVALWGVPFLMKAYHFSLLKASLACNLVFLGVAGGSPLIGWLDGRFQKRRWLLAGCALLSALILFLLIEVTTWSTGILFTLMILLGMAATGYVPTFAVAVEIVPQRLRNTSIGFANTLSVGTAPLIQPLVGWILGQVGGVGRVTTLDHYTVSDYQMALMVLPIAVLIAAVLAFAIPERGAIKK